MNANSVVLALGLFWPILLLPTALQADTPVYRCSDDSGVVTFSDRPCDEQAEPYQGRGRLSVIAGSDDVAERAALNRAFIEQRRERAEMRAEQPPARSPEPPRADPPGTGTRNVYVPYWLTRPTRPEQRPQPLPSQPQTQTREERFSALGGRQPGSVRRDDQ
ncbi:MAG: DUF4124 domain-containing protein [Wenzhouxiangella sp.]|nr:MAG: DUF4124 domain-containing protein [Wenzhouxiangella sp.]